MRTLFVPFEGVLHPADVQFSVRGRPYLPDSRHGHQLFEHANLLGWMLSNFPDVRLVLATPWVEMFGIVYCLKRLPQSVRGRVIGTTAELKAGEASPTGMGCLVERYVRRAGMEHWAVLHYDRWAFPEHIRERVLLTDPTDGIWNEGARDGLAHWLLSKPISEQIAAGTSGKVAGVSYFMST